MTKDCEYASKIIDDKLRTPQNAAFFQIEKSAYKGMSIAQLETVVNRYHENQDSWIHKLGLGTPETRLKEAISHQAAVSALNERLSEYPESLNLKKNIALKCDSK
jgi:hypothetical protein